MYNYVQTKAVRICSLEHTDALLEHLFIRSMTNSISCTILRSDDGDILGEWSNSVGDGSNHTSISVVWVEPWNIQMCGKSTVQIYFTSLCFQNRNKVVTKNAIAVLNSNGVPLQCNCCWVNCISRKVWRSFTGRCDGNMWQKLNVVK